MMYLVTIHAAKTNLSRLIERVLAGEEVVIARGDVPVARLVPLPLAVTPVRQAGTLRGKLEVTDQFFEPLSADELAGWEQ
jgi:antitoxin (DNA-binding transcriptional repressor) of toxin-antitoxin stability system